MCHKLSAPCVALLAALIALGGQVSWTSAQGLLVDVSSDRAIRLPRPIIVIHPHPHPIPRPQPQPTRYKIKELSVQAKLVDQVAKVQVSQSFVNTGSRQMEVCFVFPLPYDGAVDRLTLLVDGKEYAAELLDADKAREMYEAIVRKNKDPALLEWMGTGMFKTSVFPVPAGAERKVTLRYSQLCRKNQGLTEFLFPLSTAKYTSHPVEKVKIDVAIESGAKIKNVYSPTHDIQTKRPDNKHATVSFTSKDEVPTNDFRLFYDIGKKKLGAQVLSYRPEKDEDGYFLLLASPEVKAEATEPVKKTAIFVVDRSGSMSGKKIDQAKSALRSVLNNLNEGDLFNIVAYDSEVESFRPELQKYDKKTRQAALGFVEGIYAGGSTNIDGALSAALDQLQDTSRPNMIIFLTDGLPTVGETNEAKIVAGAKQANDVRARLFAFGVGYDVNSRLLDRLARENFGQSEYVRPDEDIEASVAKLYNRIAAPVMTEVAIDFQLDGHKTEDGPPVNRVYPKEVYDVFAGEQIVMVGRYKTPGTAKVVVQGKVDDKQEKLDFPAKLVKTSGDQTNSFVEKIWAMRRVGEIIDQIDLKGKNDELVEELVTLATKHGILTPYTSFLADENSDHRDVAQAAEATGRQLDALKAADGVSGFAQRRAKGELQRSNQAPAAAAPGGRGGAFFFSDKEDKKVAVNTVQTVGSKTFFLRNNQWVDSALTAEQEKNPQKIERFSKEYFRLAEKYGRDAASWFAIDDPVVVELGGQAYAF